MVLSTPFTCPNGHSFTANAKLRARCPECGIIARKNFQATTPDPEPEVIPEPEVKEPKIPEPEHKVEPEKKVKVLRRGRHSSPPKEKPMPKNAPKVKLAEKKGLVSHKRVRHTVVPIVRGKPTGNREHKVVTPGEDKPYWEKVSDRYWG